MLILHKDVGTRNIPAKAVPQSHLWANSFTAVQRFLASLGAAETIQPPCLPDLAPAEYLSLIPEVKIDLKGSRFQDAEEMKKNATT